MPACYPPHILYRAAFGAFALAWAVLSAPWLTGEYTIPYDAKAHFHAQLQFLANALHSGQSPFWTPNVFAGSPQIADPQSLIFSPAILIAYFSAHPTFTMVDAYVLGLLGCGGLAVLMFFKDRGWHPAGGLVAALAFAFGASAAWRIQHIGQIQSYVFFGMAIWLVDRAMHRSSGLWGTLAGICIGFMVAEPNQVAFLAVSILIGFVLVRVAQEYAASFSARRIVAPLVPAVVVAALVSFLPVMLTYLFVEQSSRSAVGYPEAVLGSLHPASLLTMLVGDLFGAFDPMVQYWGPYSVAWDPTNQMLSQNMSQLYIGALPMVLVLTVGLVRGVAWTLEIRFFTVALFAMIFYALGGYTPVYYFLYHLVPGVDLFRRPADATFLVGALAAVVGGYSVHRFFGGTVPETSVARRYTERALIIGLFLTSFGVAVRMGHVADALKPLMLAALFTGMAATAVWIAHRFSGRYAVACFAAVAGLATVDLRLNNGPNQSTALSIAEYDILKPDCKNETIRLLKEKLHQPLPSARRDRVELVGLGFEWPNVGLIHGFDHSLGYNPLRLELVNKAIGADDTIAGWDQRRFTPLFPSYHSLLADMLGLRYIASSVPIEQVDKNLKPGDLVPIARTADAFIYENSHALPRVLFVPGWQLADFKKLVADGAWPKFDPTRTLLLESEPSVPHAPAEGNDEGAGAATIARYENTIVDIDVTAPKSGFVLLNSIWHPWWRASVDGEQVDVLKANVLFRAVQVPAGRHKVRFDFEPIAGAVAELAQPLARSRLRERRKAQSRPARFPASGL